MHMDLLCPRLPFRLVLLLKEDCPDIKENDMLPAALVPKLSVRLWTWLFKKDSGKRYFFLCSYLWGLGGMFWVSTIAVNVFILLLKTYLSIFPKLFVSSAITTFFFIISCYKLRFSEVNWFTLIERFSVCRSFSSFIAIFSEICYLSAL